jgi:hypothetical protein
MGFNKTSVHWLFFKLEQKQVAHTELKKSLYDYSTNSWLLWS